MITDQQRAPQHWPDEPGWLAELMPNDAELARTGLSFSNAYCNSAMCSPSRASLFTGRYPAEHGVGLTLTAADPVRPASAGPMSSCAECSQPSAAVLSTPGGCR